MALAFPSIDPVAFSFTLGEHAFAVHWYALSYVAGFLLAWRVAIGLTRLYAADMRPNREDIDEFISWAIAGVLLGGRLGYVLFYNLPAYADQPLEALKVWHGGMSFHGGALGVILALFLFSRVRRVPMLRLSDIATCVVPIGLGLGRLANFVNGELYGRVTDGALGIVFPRGGDLPRHPSQLYEAVFEGPVLFLILFLLMRIEAVRARQGIVAGAFLFFYGLFRFSIEFFREPDVQLGFLFDAVTMGQILSIPMMLAGGALMIWRARCPKI